MPHIERTRSAKVEKQYAELVAGTWGLNRCPVGVTCGVCDLYGDDKSHLRQLRNLYLTGLPLKMLPSLLDPNGEADFTYDHIRRHSIRAGWVQRRGKMNKIEMDQDAMLRLLLRRAEQSKDVVAGNSHDKVLELIMRMKGFDQQKVTVEGTMQVTWEQLIAKGRKGDATITLPDEDFSEVRLQEIEGERAEAD